MSLSSSPSIATAEQVSGPTTESPTPVKAPKPPRALPALVGLKRAPTRRTEVEYIQATDEQLHGWSEKRVAKMEREMEALQKSGLSIERASFAATSRAKTTLVFGSGKKELRTAPNSLLARALNALASLPVVEA